MNEANFLDMNFLYRQIYMLCKCISIKPTRVINTPNLQSRKSIILCKPKLRINCKRLKGKCTKRKWKLGNWQVAPSPKPQPPNQQRIKHEECEEAGLVFIPMTADVHQQMRHLASMKRSPGIPFSNQSTICDELTISSLTNKNVTMET